MLTADGHIAVRAIILSPDEPARPGADHPRSPYHKARSTRRVVSAVIPRQPRADRAPQADGAYIALRTECEPVSELAHDRGGRTDLQEPVLTSPRGRA
jgi:hypothetical protein